MKDKTVTSGEKTTQDRTAKKAKRKLCVLIKKHSKARLLAAATPIFLIIKQTNKLVDTNWPTAKTNIAKLRRGVADGDFKANTHTHLKWLGFDTQGKSLSTRGLTKN